MPRRVRKLAPQGLEKGKTATSFLHMIQIMFSPKPDIWIDGRTFVIIVALLLKIRVLKAARTYMLCSHISLSDVLDGFKICWNIQVLVMHMERLGKKNASFLVKV